jgi:6-pyruvoyltetrahydropterin/6-carboxytetrahydropterin synthase
MMSKENCTLTKIYTFSAAHRLHNEKFSDQMNQEIFGKCNNKNGHGHDYTLELTVKSNIDDDTGMIVDLRLLDRVVEPLIEELDHKRLDVQIDYFLQVRASGENIAKYIWMNLVDKIPKPAYLYHIRLWETSENFFDYKEAL